MMSEEYGVFRSGFFESSALCSSEDYIHCVSRTCELSEFATNIIVRLFRNFWIRSRYLAYSVMGEIYYLPYGK
jgi:hypothetical protein